MPVVSLGTYRYVCLGWRVDTFPEMPVNGKDAAYLGGACSCPFAKIEGLRESKMGKLCRGIGDSEEACGGHP
jgi:hypothetical protein